MHTTMTVTDRSRIAIDPDADTPTVKIVEVHRPELACQPDTVTLTFTDPTQLDDLISAATAAMFGFLSDEQIEALR